jgi:thiol-disulfide isomerase/thioredoxin
MVIDFYATWCGPCLLMAKELEKVAAELGDAVRIVKLDVDANPDIASQVSTRERERDKESEREAKRACGGLFLNLSPSHFSFFFFSFKVAH